MRLARLGRGLLPEKLIPGQKTSSSFLHHGTRAMFEKASCRFEGHLGLQEAVMRRTIPPVHG